MKKSSAFLRPLFALALAFSTLPAWSMQMACARRGPASLACVRLCAHSAALLTQDGKLASLGHGDCSVRSQPSDDSLTAERAQAPQSVDALFCALAPAPVVTNAAPGASLCLRGPPSPSLFLWCQHPSANAPPSFV